MRLGQQGQRRTADGEKTVSLKENVLRQLSGAVFARMGSITHASGVAVAKLQWRK